MTLHDNQAAYWAGAAKDVDYIAGSGPTGINLYDQQLAGYNASVMPQQGGSKKQRGKRKTNRRKTNRRKTNRRRYN